MRSKQLAIVKDALLLSLIHIQQIPAESAPTKEIRAALYILDESTEEAKRHQGVLKEILSSIYDAESGAVLRPRPEVAEMLRKEIEGAEQ